MFRMGLVLAPPNGRVTKFFENDTYLQNPEDIGLAWFGGSGTLVVIGMRVIHMLIAGEGGEALERRETTKKMSADSYRMAKTLLLPFLTVYSQGYLTLPDRHM